MITERYSCRYTIYSLDLLNPLYLVGPEYSVENENAETNVYVDELFTWKNITSQYVMK